MKKVTIKVDGASGEEDRKAVGGALNDLSGVVAADFDHAAREAYAFAGDRLRARALSDALLGAGFIPGDVSEEYLSGADYFQERY